MWGTTIGSSGHFTADADLTARFGGGDIAANEQWQIDGTISDFRDDAGEAIANSAWEVNLNKIEDINTGGPTFTEGTTNGGGSWTATFYGETADNVQPSGVAGEFNAHFGNGHVVGAYGADKE